VTTRMDEKLKALLASLNRLSSARSQSPATIPCKVCGAEARFYDVVDFNKVASEPDFYPFGRSGVTVAWHRCGACDFLFTTFFDDWSSDDFRRFVYNADYELIDQEYEYTRPKHTADHLSELLRGFENLRILDYGSGSGTFARCMSDKSFCRVEQYDPFSHPNRPAGTFAIVVCYEVIEHSTSPLGTLSDMSSLLDDDGCMIVGQTLQPHDINLLRANWWYCAPRNGHCSTYTGRTLAKLCGQLGLLFHCGSPIVIKHRHSPAGDVLVQRLNLGEAWVT